MGLLGLHKVENFNVLQRSYQCGKNKTWVSISFLQIGRLVPGWVAPERNRGSTVIFFQ